MTAAVMAPSGEGATPSSTRQPIDPVIGALRARDEALRAGRLTEANAFSWIAELQRELEATRRELAMAQTRERAECIVLVEQLAEQFRQGCETDWEYGAREAASVLRGRR